MALEYSFHFARSKTYYSTKLFISVLVGNSMKTSFKSLITVGWVLYNKCCHVNPFGVTVFFYFLSASARWGAGEGRKKYWKGFKVWTRALSGLDRDIKLYENLINCVRACSTASTKYKQWVGQGAHNCKHIFAKRLRSHIIHDFTMSKALHPADQIVIFP